MRAARSERGKYTLERADLIIYRYLTHPWNGFGHALPVPAGLQVEPTIAQAFEIANKAGLTPEELEDQEGREIFIQDQRGAITLAEQRGMGKGRQEERLRIAQTLLDMTEDNALITAKTVLSIDSVRRLRSAS